MAATQALGESLIGTDKPFVTTGGTLMLAMAGITGRPDNENDQSEGGPRVDAATYTVTLAQQGVRTLVVRLAPMVHSDLDHHGFTNAMIDFARENGAAAYVGDGSNRWPAANTYDIGALYRLALEQAPAGSTFHGVGDPGIPRKVIARRSPASSAWRPRASLNKKRPSTSASSPPSPVSTTPLSADHDIATRAVCEAVGVGQPMLYRLFGDMRGLLDAVADQGLERYAAQKDAREQTADPVAELRAAGTNT